MMSIKNISIRLIAFSVFFFFIAGIGAYRCQAGLHLYLISKHENVGDHAQVQGISSALMQLSGEKPTVKDFDFKELGKAKSLIHTQIKEFPKDKHLLITVSDYGIDVISDFLIMPGLRLCHSSHMVTSRHKDLLNKAHFIVLPKHALNEDFKKAVKNSRTVLIETIGVAHNRKLQSLEEAYEHAKDRIPLYPRYVCVILGGDAPTPEGVIKFFTKAEAVKLAEYVAKRTEKGGGHILLLNGPRTGRRDPVTSEIIGTVHKDGRIDPVTGSFISRLEALKPKDGFTFFKFQFGQTSDFDSVMGGIKHANAKNLTSVVLVPGESTSMISECVDTLPLGSVIVYKTNSMNHIHEAHVQSEYEAGRISLLDHHYEIIPRKKEIKGVPSSAAQQVAATLLPLL